MLFTKTVMLDMNQVEAVVNQILADRVENDPSNVDNYDYEAALKVESTVMKMIEKLVATSSMNMISSLGVTVTKEELSTDSMVVNILYNLNAGNDQHEPYQFNVESGKLIYV